MNFDFGFFLLVREDTNQGHEPRPRTKALVTKDVADK